MIVNVAGIQSMLDLYRSALESKIPVAPALQAHFAQNRQQLLEGLAKVANGQKMLLRCMTPESDEEQVQWEEAMRIVEEFAVWAKDG